MRFTDTTKVAITIVDRRRTAKFPASVAELISAPSPKVDSTCPLKWKYSATMLAFQAPPEAVTRPVIRYGKMAGRITVRQRSTLLKRKMSATSRNSEGIAMAPAITLNRMYHCVPSSINRIEPVLSPPPRLINPSSKTGKRAVAGTEAATCAMGWAIRARRGLKPMATPAGIVHADAITSAATTRKNVAPALSSVIRMSARVIVLSTSRPWKTPCRISSRATMPARTTTPFCQLDGSVVVSGGRRAEEEYNRSMRGVETLVRNRPNKGDLRSRLRTGEECALELSTCSSLNLSDHAIAGRQTN